MSYVDPNEPEVRKSPFFTSSAIGTVAAGAAFALVAKPTLIVAGVVAAGAGVYYMVGKAISVATRAEGQNPDDLKL